MHYPVLRRFIDLKEEYELQVREAPTSVGNKGNTTSLGGDAIINGCYFVMYMKPVLFRQLN
jgi:hypothetical protein